MKILTQSNIIAVGLTLAAIYAVNNVPQLSGVKRQLGL